MSDIDLQDLRLRAQRVREFDFRLDGEVLFHLRHPSRYEAERIFVRHRGDMAALLRHLVETSIIGWAGVCVRHAVPEAKHGDQPLAWSPEAAELILDERTEWIDAIGTAIVNRMTERHARMDDTRKNSPSGPPGSAPAATDSSSPLSDSEL
jgi:hypothetical protein